MPQGLAYDSQQSESLLLPTEVTHYDEQEQQEDYLVLTENPDLFSSGSRAFEVKRGTDRVLGMAAPTLSLLFL